MLQFIAYILHSSVCAHASIVRACDLLVCVHCMHKQVVFVCLQRYMLERMYMLQAQLSVFTQSLHTVSCTVSDHCMHFSINALITLLSVMQGFARLICVHQQKSKH
jgi:hypothetical protein